MSRQQQPQFIPLCGICHEPYNEPIMHPECVSLSESVRDDLEDLEFLEKRMNFGARPKRHMVRVSAAFAPLPSVDENMPVISAFGDRTKTFSRRPSVEQKTHAFELRRRSTILQDISRPGRRRASVQVNPLSQEIMADGKDIFSTYDADKPANSRLRWNLLWLVFCLLAPYPLWLTFIPGGCTLSYEITILMNVLLTANFMYTTILCWQYMWRMIRAFNTPFWQELDPETRAKLRHIVVMPTYKEPVELLCETLSSIANQTVSGSIIMVVGMEEKTPDQDMKRQIIKERFEQKFCALIFSVHPTGIPGEIPGACSNRNYAARTAVKYMISEGLLPVDPETRELELDFCTISVCDADTTYYYRYFENLSWAFLNEPPETRYQVCWQSPLFYNISLDKRWFFTRAMGILRSYFMIGFLIGGSINTMSIYSMSLGLLIKSQFFHPGYQMDDIIYTLSAMRATGVRIQIRTLDIPTLSGPTSGNNFISEFREWVIQATRWTIGAAEVFHYFFVKLLKKNYFLPGLAYFWWFVYYYGFVLCVSGLVAISNLVAQLVGLAVEDYSMSTCKPCQSWFNLDDDSAFYSWIMPSFLLFNYTVVFSTAFIMDALVSQILALDEQIHPLRNFMHWLSSQAVLWVYCLVEYRAIFRIAYYGKEVCGHKASEKHALVSADLQASIAVRIDPPDGGNLPHLPPSKRSPAGRSNHSRFSSNRSIDSLQSLFDASGASLLAPVEETSHGESDEAPELVEEMYDEVTERRGSGRDRLHTIKPVVGKRSGRDIINELSDGVLVFEASQQLSLEGSKLTMTDERSSSDFKDSLLSMSLEDSQDNVVDGVGKDSSSGDVKRSGLVDSSGSTVLEESVPALVPGGNRRSYKGQAGNEQSYSTLDGPMHPMNPAGPDLTLESGNGEMPQLVGSQVESVEVQSKGASPSDSRKSTKSNQTADGSELVGSVVRVDYDGSDGYNESIPPSGTSPTMLTNEDEKSGSDSFFDDIDRLYSPDESLVANEPTSETNGTDTADPRIPIVPNVTPAKAARSSSDERKETGNDDLRVSLHSITSVGDESTGDFEINMKFLQQTSLLRQSMQSVKSFQSERIDL